MTSATLKEIAMGKDAHGFQQTSIWMRAILVEQGAAFTPCEPVTVQRVLPRHGFGRLWSDRCAGYWRAIRVEVPEPPPAEPSDEQKALAAASRKALERWAADNDY